MGLRYRIPFPGLFCFSGRVGPKHWFPRSGRTDPGPMGFIVKWFIVYPGIVFFGAGLAIMVAPFYGVFWTVRRWVRSSRKCQPVARCFPVHASTAIRLLWRSGVTGLTCLDPTHRSVADVSPPGCGQGEHQGPRLEAIGSKTTAPTDGAYAPQHKPNHGGKRRHHEHEACGTEAHQRCDPPPFETEQRNHPGRHHLPDSVMLRRCGDARCRGGHMGPVGRTRGTVTPRNSDNTNSRGRERYAYVL